MTVQQLALDLWGTGQTRPPDPHQRGLIRLPWDTAAHRAGDLVPAWVCCRCGGVELSRYLLELDHNCDRDWITECSGAWHPYRMDAHWIAPAVPA